MAVPPILEVYVLWHPDDDLGAQVSEWLMEHFHGPAYAGLAGGAVEVYLRSTGWRVDSGPPRPLPFMQPLPAGLPSPQICAVVPVLGRALAKAVRDDDQWHDYLHAVFAADTLIAGSAARGDPVVGVYPLWDPRAEISGSTLGTLASHLQALPRQAAAAGPTLARELSQAIAQRLHQETASGAGGDRITVFISHTKWHAPTQRDAGPQLVATVRDVLQGTHLDAFFDAHDLQVGEPWEATLDTAAGRNALLMVRTDLYASREWTQREVVTAKENDLPVVALYAVREQEERGSFLMDHVPVIPCPPGSTETAVERALNRLVDETLKRALWLAQRIYLEPDGFDWLPVHAPEPVTLVKWLHERRAAATNDAPTFIMHPDPPLGPREQTAITDLCALAGLTDKVDILTPRTFATRGGRRSP